MNIAVADDRTANRGPIVSNGPGRASGRAPVPWPRRNRGREAGAAALDADERI